MVFASIRRPSWLIALVAVCVFASACSSSSTETEDDEEVVEHQTVSDEQTAQETFVRANEALDATEWERAVELYTEVTDLDPQRWDAHMNRGIALTQLGEYDEAVDAFSDSLESGGREEPMVYFNLGNLYQRRSMYESSIDAYRTSLAHRDELDYDTLLNISASYTFLNVFDDAEQTVQRAIEVNPDDPRGPLTLGLIAFSQENPDRALEIYDELVAMHPEFAPARYNRAFVLLRSGELEEARSEFTTYLELSPEGSYVQKAESHIATIDRRLERADE